MYEFNEWLTQNKMQLSILGCGTFTKDANFKIGEFTIPEVDNYKYLGIKFAKNGIDQQKTLELAMKKLDGCYYKLKKHGY